MSRSTFTWPPAARARSHSASAWSSARSKRCGRMPYRRGASSPSRGRRSVSRLSISGRTSSSGCPVTAATTALAGGRERAPEAERQPPDAHRLRDPLDHAAVGHHVRARRRRATARPHPAPAGSGRGTRSRRARRSAGCGCRASAATAARATAPRGERECESSTTPRRSRWTRAGRWSRGRRTSRISSTSSLDLRCGETRVLGGHDAAEVDDPLDPGARGRLAEALRHPAVAAGEVAVGRRPPSSGSR